MNIIERTDRLKERVEEYLQENEISAMTFSKLAHISELIGFSVNLE